MSAGDAAPPRFTRLVPAPPAELSAAESLAGWSPSGDGVALNMIASVDGRIAVGGRSGPLGGPGDRALFHALRERADAVMAGAGTIRAERYGPMIRDRAERERRRANGLEPNPLAVIVSRSLEIDPTVPLLADPDSRVVVLTPSAGALTGCAAQIEYIRTPALRPALAALRDRYGVRSILCEGGPRLNGSLAAESLIDEIFIALSPLLVGDIPGGRSVVLGNAPPSPCPLALRTLLLQDGTLFAHYVARP